MECATLHLTDTLNKSLSGIRIFRQLMNCNWFIVDNNKIDEKESWDVIDNQWKQSQDKCRHEQSKLTENIKRHWLSHYREKKLYAKQNMHMNHAGYSNKMFSRRGQEIFARKKIKVQINLLLKVTARFPRILMPIRMTKDTQPFVWQAAYNAGEKQSIKLLINAGWYMSGRVGCVSA